MKNGNLEQFLDTGWYTEAVLYYEGYVYWCEGTTDFETHVTIFMVERWRAKCDGELYHQFVTTDGKLVDYSTVLKLVDSDMDKIKKDFLESPIFGGRTFWQAEKDVIWVERGENIVV